MPLKIQERQGANMINQYFNPENPAEVWTNDGVKMHPMPQWVQARLAGGKNLQDCILVPVQAVQADKQPSKFKQVDSTGEEPLRNCASGVMCPVCLKVFERDLLQVGRKSDYCSNACKQKAYRQRNKPLRNAQHQTDKKLLPVSKRSNVVELSTAGKVIGVSGTVHRFPIKPLMVIKAPAPYLRSFDDLQSFFGGSLS